MGIYTGKAKFSNGWLKFCYIDVKIENQQHQYTMIVLVTLNKHLSILPPYLPSTACKYIQSNESRDREQSTVRSKLGHSLDYDFVFLFSCSRMDKQSIQKYIQFNV